MRRFTWLLGGPRPVMLYTGTTAGSVDLASTAFYLFGVVGGWNLTFTRLMTGRVQGSAGGGGGSGNTGLGNAGGGQGAYDSTGELVLFQPYHTYSIGVGAGGAVGVMGGSTFLSDLTDSVVYLNLTGGGPGGNGASGGTGGPVVVGPHAVAGVAGNPGNEGTNGGGGVSASILGPDSNFYGGGGRGYDQPTLAAATAGQVGFLAITFVS